MEQFINPFTDFGFKRLFGEEFSKPVLIDFLNQLLPEEQSPVRELSFSGNEHFGRYETDRKAIFDIYCVGENGERFIIEMQKAEQKFFKDRSVFYSTFPIQEQAEKGRQWDFRLKAVYTIGILNFVFDEDVDAFDKYLYHIKLTDQETKRIFYDKLTYIYLEMPKFAKSYGELESRFDKWVWFLKHLSELDSVPEGVERDGVFAAFFEQARIAKLTKAERGQYEESLKVYRDLTNVIGTSFDKGVKKGREEGREEGRKEGIREGIEQGIEQEYQKRLATARKMLSDGLLPEQVAQYTDISIEKLKGTSKKGDILPKV